MLGYIFAIELVNVHRLNLWMRERRLLLSDRNNNNVIGVVGGGRCRVR